MPVLAVARNVVSAIRLLEVVALFGDDPRVRIHWTIAPGSAFSAETDGYLTRVGVRLTPWERACEREYALIMATSANGDLDRLSGPLMLLPHGAGYSRVVALGQSAPAGLAPGQLVRAGRVIAQVVGLEHEDQRARLATYCPEAAPLGVVLGDPTRDRMAHGARLRGLYRGALAVPDRCALVVMSSTWGPGSLLAAHPDLPAQLAAALPFDEYRLAAIVHPNAAARMGAWEVGRLLLRARSSGLQLVPPDRWEGAILAADLVIGDHGSVSLYAAAAGTGVLFGAYDGAQIVPGSPMAELAARIPRLDPRGDLASQVRAGLAQDTQGHAYRQARDAFGAVGRSLEVTGQVAYRILGLVPPSRCVGVRAPEPVSRGADARASHLVLVGRDPSGRVDLVVRRFAPGIDPDLLAGYEAAEVCRHLAVGEFELDMTVRENAEVLVLGHAADLRPVGKALAAALAREAGCLRVASAVTGPGRCVAVVRGLDAVELEAEDPGLDAGVLPSVLVAVAALEHGDPAAAVKRLRTGVRVLVGGAASVVTAYDAASVQPSRPR